MLVGHSDASLFVSRKREDWNVVPARIQFRELAQQKGPLASIDVYIDNNTSHSKNTVDQLGNETNTATHFTQGEKRIAEGSQTAKETSKGLLTN